MIKDYLPNLVIALYRVLFLGLTYATGQKIPFSSSKFIEELVGLESEWLSTHVSGDKAEYDRIVADDFTGTDGSATLRNKADDRALLLSARVPGGSAVNEETRVRVYANFAKGEKAVRSSVNRTLSFRLAPFL